MKFRIDKYDPPVIKEMRQIEEIIEVIEVYCSHFGCGKELTLAEKLRGDRCIDHQQKKSLQFHGNW